MNTTGLIIPRMTPIEIAFFWSKVEIKRSRCYPYKGKTRHGYGRHSIRNHQYFAHRIAWTLIKGPIPDDLWVLHRCDNPACCNWEHLIPGDHSQNMQECVARGRHSGGDLDIAREHRTFERARGESHHNSKLSEQDIREIRTRYQDGESRNAIARDFPVTPSTISRIVQFETWTHVK